MRRKVACESVAVTDPCDRLSFWLKDQLVWACTGRPTPGFLLIITPLQLRDFYMTLEMYVYEAGAPIKHLLTVNQTLICKQFFGIHRILQSTKDEG